MTDLILTIEIFIGAIAVIGVLITWLAFYIKKQVITHMEGTVSEFNHEVQKISRDFTDLRLELAGLMPSMKEWARELLDKEYVHKRELEVVRNDINNLGERLRAVENGNTNHS